MRLVDTVVLFGVLTSSVVMAYHSSHRAFARVRHDITWLATRMHAVASVNVCRSTSAGKLMSPALARDHGRIMAR